MEPLDGNLFTLFAAAISTGLEHVRRRRAEHGYIGAHLDWPVLTWRDNGMPLIAEQLEGPIDYSDALTAPIFPPELRNSQMRFEHEASFVSLLEYARAHPQISKHLGTSYPQLLESQARGLVGDVLDRYIHTTGLFELNQHRLLPLYLEVEKYLLEDVLMIAILVPILCLRFEAERIDIDEHTSIVKLSDKLHLARTPNRRFQYESDPRVQTAATHALALTNYTVKNENVVSMWHAIGNAESYPLKLIDDFYAALRLATEHPTGYAQLLVLPLGWASSYKADLVPLQKTSVRNYPPWFENGYWKESVPTLTSQKMEDIANLFRRIRKLSDKRLSVALRRLNLSSLRTNGEDGLLDAMIGLEALLSDGNQEMTYKIAMRMAGLYKLLGTVGSTDVVREVKTIYGLRSKVVHGSDFDIKETLDRGDKKIGVVDAAVEHLRAALRVLIERNEYLDVAKIDRELLLGALTRV